MPPKYALQSDLETIQANVISAMKKEFHKMSEDIKTEFTALLSKRDEEIKTLQHEVVNLKKFVNKLESTIDDCEAIDKKDQIILSGPHIPVGSNEEDCVQIVRTVIKDRLKLDIPKTDIVFAHRLGYKPKSQKEDKRNLVVKMANLDSKRNLLITGKKMKNEVYINDVLTPRRNTIFYVLRKVKKLHPDVVTGCTTFDGKVYAFVKRSSNHALAADPALANRDTRIPINSRTNLENFCQEFLDKNVCDFLDTWPH